MGNPTHCSCFPKEAVLTRNHELWSATPDDTAAIFQAGRLLKIPVGYIVVHAGSGVTVDAVYATYELALQCLAHLATTYPTVVFTILQV